MNFQANYHPPIAIVGIALRTSNDAEGPSAIAAHWNRFYAEQLAQKIPYKKNLCPVALYTDYASDEKGAYTLIVGYEVEKIETVPEGMVARQIPAANYTHFVASGPFPNCLIKTWQEIWKAPLKRAFQADFEFYPEGPLDPANTKINLLIGTR